MLKIFKQLILIVCSGCLLTACDKDFEKIEQEAIDATNKAVEFAENSPFPDESELFTDVYA